MGNLTGLFSSVRQASRKLNLIDEQKINAVLCKVADAAVARTAEILEANKDTAIRIPMFDEERSLNLANSVAIALYEALRQNGFPNLG